MTNKKIGRCEALETGRLGQPTVEFIFENIPENRFSSERTWNLRFLLLNKVGHFDSLRTKSFKVSVKPFRKKVSTEEKEKKIVLCRRNSNGTFNYI